jgi:hypothetical protein
VEAAESAEGTAAAVATGAGEAAGAAGSSGRRMAAVGPLVCLERGMQVPENAAERRPWAASSRRPWWMRKSMPMIGKVTAERRKLHVKVRPANTSDSSWCPQHLMAPPSGPSRRGHEGGEEEECGMIL